MLGTRFLLAAEKDATRLQVDEGAVNFTRTEDKQSIEVRSAFFAVAAPGSPWTRPRRCRAASATWTSISPQASRPATASGPSRVAR